MGGDAADDSKTATMLKSSDVPQRPRRIDKIIALVAELDGIKAKWETFSRKERRAADYVCQAAKILGLVTHSAVSQARLTATGRVFIGMAALERRRRLSFAFEGSRIGRAWLAWAKVGDLRHLQASHAAAFLRECAEGLSEGPKGTLATRASTLSTWLGQLIEARNQIDMDDHRPMRPPCDLRLLKPSIFEPTRSRDLVHALVQGCSRIDIATGFFTLDGYHLIADGLDNPDIRILVGGLDADSGGRSAAHAEFLVRFVRSLDRGLDPPPNAKRSIIEDIYRKIVHGRIAFRTVAARESRRLHAKVYIFDRRAVFVTSANLTKSGLCIHIEGGQLATEKEDVCYFAAKFDEHWEQAAPLAEELLRSIEESWVFRDAVSPYLAFLRALFLLYGRMKAPERIPARQLAEFQKLIVAHIIGKFAERRGVMLVAPTGTGKTVMAAYVAAALHGSQIRRVVVICNNDSLEQYWRRELQMVGIDAAIITSGKLRGKSRNPKPSLADIDHLRKNLHEDTLVIVDECHQYRTPRRKGYQRLRSLLLPSEWSDRPYALLLTATPISRGLENMQALLQLTTYDEVEPLRGVGEAAEAPGVMNVTLPDIVRRFGEDDLKTRTRALWFADGRKYYPSIELQLKGYPSFMDGIFTDLEALAEALKDYEEMIEDLLEEDEDAEITGNLGRQANLMKTLLARRAESSPRALVSTLERIISLLDKRDLAEVEKRKLRQAIEPILARAQRLEEDTNADEKILDLLALLKARKQPQKVLIFSEYIATAKYLHERLEAALPRCKIELLTGEASRAMRRRAIRSFAPEAQGADDHDESEILIGTDAISEGENLQDARMLVNYDLPWTPLRLVQRLGRIDRPTEYSRKVRAFNYFPLSELYRGMISHWTRLEERSSHVREISSAEVLRSTTRDPHAYRGNAEQLYFESIATYDDLIESVKDRQLPTSSFLQAQLMAEPDVQREAETLPPGIRTARRGTNPGLYLLVEIEGRFVCIAHPSTVDLAEEVDRLVFLRALQSRPDTPLSALPADMDRRIEVALNHWSERISPSEAGHAQVQIALWVSES